MSLVRFFRRCLEGILLCFVTNSMIVSAAEEITLTPIQVSAHVYYFQGHAGMASSANKGFMSNAGFIVTKEGVVVYDALATPVLGRAMIAAIRKVTSVPIKKVIVGHYHADHIYGLQAFKEIGAQIVAHDKGRIYLQSDLAQQRLAQRKADLFPWVDERTQLIPADQWLRFDHAAVERFSLGGFHFQILDSSGAHSDEDMLLLFEEEGVLFAGDIYFSGRIPFVGNADSFVWLRTLQTLREKTVKLVIPGHGAYATDPQRDIAFTIHYLRFLREKMGHAVQEFIPFEEAYQQINWAEFEVYPAFKEANRLNAYGTYILMEKESLSTK